MPDVTCEFGEMTLPGLHKICKPSFIVRLTEHYILTLTEHSWTNRRFQYTRQLYILFLSNE